MFVFEELFRASNGKPVVYQGRELIGVDFVQTKKGQQFRVVFEGFNSEWRQGIMLRSKAPIRLAGQVLKVPVVLWQDTAPTTVGFAMEKAGELQVKNVWDRGKGRVESWQGGAAMIVEDLPNGRRYRCNDGHPDEDFDDIVFRLERIS